MSESLRHRQLSDASEQAPSERRRPILLCGALLLGAAFLPSDAFAAEAGTSFYIPGLKGPLAGFLPPPGHYLQDDFYFYDGEIGGGRNILIGGNLVANVRQTTYLNFLTPIWVTPVNVLGGNLAFSATLPFGQPDVRARAVLDGPIINRIFGGPLSRSARDSTFNIGDPVLTGMVGWHSGNFHWNVGASVSIPSGGYQPGELSNVALNRWVGDFFGALTYLDMARGIELSTVGGFTVNGENFATNYDTGNELHVDVALSQYLSKQLSIGVIASHYQQITGDSGSGARLGAFEGRVTAVGGTLGYSFLVGARRCRLASRCCTRSRSRIASRARSACCPFRFRSEALRLLRLPAPSPLDIDVRDGESRSGPSATFGGAACRPPQCPLNTRVWTGSSSAWIRKIMACTTPTASTA